MLDRANSGPEPSAEILRAIRHGVAAGACSVAARETRDPKWWRLAQEQREKARCALHQADARLSREARRPMACGVGSSPSMAARSRSARFRR
jgi:hypothetical protein